MHKSGLFWTIFAFWTAQSSFAFDVKDVWQITSKKCGETVLQTLPQESYKLDDSHWIRIEKKSETSTELCKIGLVYDRIISSFQTEGTVYKETSILQGTLAKKTCWKKQNGTILQPPTTNEVIEVTPHEMGLSFQANGGILKAQLSNSQECPNGTLHLELKKQGF